jgi:hypothetical protein
MLGLHLVEQDEGLGSAGRRASHTRP